MTFSFSNPPGAAPGRQRQTRGVLLAATLLLLASPASGASTVTLPDGTVLPVAAPSGYAPVTASVPVGAQAVQLSTLPDTGAGDLAAIRSQTNGVATAALQTGANARLDTLHGDNQAFQGAVAMTVGAAQTAQRSVGMACTQAGNVALVLADASTITLPVAIGWQTFPFAATTIASATATCVYSNLK